MKKHLIAACLLPCLSATPALAREPLAPNREQPAQAAPASETPAAPNDVAWQVPGRPVGPGIPAGPGLPAGPAIPSGPALPIGPQAPASIVDDRPVKHDEIRQSIEKAIGFLLERQEPDGSFERGRGTAHVGGETALVVLALLTAGVPESDPRMERALRYLAAVEMNSVYAMGVRAMVWNEVLMYRGLVNADETIGDRARRVELQRLVRRDGLRLLNGVGREGAASGMYHYTPGQGSYDHSCSNYGTMGVWAAAQAGMPVPPRYWQLVATGWKRNQNPDGGWSYTVIRAIAPARGPAAGRQLSNSTPSLTAGGLINLFITEEYTELAEEAACKPPEPSTNTNAAIWFIADNFDKIFRGSHIHYTLFNLHRVGYESGYKWLGSIDWYRRGVNYLLRTQQASGSYGSDSTINTAFGLIFLAHGSAPVVINKLQYGPVGTRDDLPPPAHWNQRPRDIANVVRFLQRDLKRHLNWQIVTTDMPLEAMQEAPILYLSGAGALEFTEKQKRQIQAYILQGGMVVANADCGAEEFAQSVRSLGGELFPRYSFRDLDDAHPLLSGEPFKDFAGKRPAVAALGNGSRELIVLIDSADVAGTWQRLPALALKPDAAVHELPDVRFARALISYATERNTLREKNNTHILPEPATASIGKIHIEQVEYAGNCDPEPFGWVQLSRVLRRDYKLDIAIMPVRLGDEPLAAGSDSLVYLTGTGEVTFTEAQRAELRRVANSGGLLIVDTAGGSPEFADSMRRELALIYGQAPQLLPPDHAVYQTPYRIERVDYREFAREKAQGPARDRVIANQGALEAIVRDGRVVAFFSPFDLATAMVGHNVDGVIGYTPDTARQLMINMIGTTQHIKPE